ncbi:MAG: redoxin domain-containing protein [Chloroflexota bacterium]
MISIGSTAPDFTLKDQNNKTVKLSRFKGKKIILSFRPLAWTPVCHDQMLLLEENFEHFKNHDTIAFGLGVDSAPSNKAWAKSMGITKTRLLADFWPHGEVAKMYGVFREADGFSERANIIIDESNKVVFTKVYPVTELPDVLELIHFLEKG